MEPVFGDPCVDGGSLGPCFYDGGHSECTCDSHRRRVGAAFVIELPPAGLDGFRRFASRRESRASGAKVGAS